MVIEDPLEQRQASLARALGGWLALAELADQRLRSELHGSSHGNAARWSPSATAVDLLLADPLAWLEAERAALVATVEQAAGARFDELAWDLAGSLINFFDLRVYLDEWQRTHEAALAAGRRAGNRRGEASLLRGCGYLSLKRNRIDDAMDCYARALPIHRWVGDRRGEVHALEEIGIVHRLQGRHAEAAACDHRAMTAFVEVGDQHGQAWVRFQVAVLHADRGEQAKARTGLVEALASFRKLGDRRGEAWALRRLGMVYAAQGDLDRAATCLELALAGLQQLGDRSVQAQILRCLGEISLRLHQWEKASRLCGECLAVAHELDDRYLEADALRSMGELQQLRANQHEVARDFERSAELWRQLDLPLELARTLDRLGVVYLDVGSLAAAESAWREAVTLFRRVGVPEAEPVRSRLEHLLETSGGA